MADTEPAIPVMRPLTCGKKPLKYRHLAGWYASCLGSRMLLRTATQFSALLAALVLASACQPEKSGTSESDTELGTDGSSSDASGSSTDDPTTTGGPGECTPGETQDGECGSSCECNDDGTWSCSDGSCPPLEEGFAETLSSQGGCSDIFVYALNPGASLAVTLNTTGLVAAAKESGVATKTDFTLPSDAIQLLARTGQNLHEDICTDFYELEPTVDLTYVPTAGTVTITVTPGPGDEVSTATAELKDVLWSLKLDPMDPKAPTVSMPSLVIKDVSVGWFPG